MIFNLLHKIVAILNTWKPKVCKDTYISFISREYFVIAQEKDNVLHYYDMVKTCQSNLYEIGKA